MTANMCKLLHSATRLLNLHTKLSPQTFSQLQFSNQSGWQWMRNMSVLVSKTVSSQSESTLTRSLLITRTNKSLSTRGILLKGPSFRTFSSQSSQDRYRNQTMTFYVCATGIFMVGMSYLGVPLYRMFCQSTGLGGQAVAGHDADKVEDMQPVKDRQIRVRFNADTASSMQWNFRPLQPEVTVLPGETALAFYTARNPTAKPIIGISTYNVVPFEAGQYFNKIQCFCFEEQRLNPHEQVDMPVFFYIDPAFAEDSKLEMCEVITLSYTFFESKDGYIPPLPGYMQPHQQQAVQ